MGVDVHVRPNTWEIQTADAYPSMTFHTSWECYIILAPLTTGGRSGKQPARKMRGKTSSVSIELSTVKVAFMCEAGLL